MRSLAAALVLLSVGSGPSTAVSGQTGALLARADFTVHDEQGRPVETLGAGDVEVFEDGAQRRVVSLRRSDVTAPATFVFFIDDLHLDFRSTPRTRELMRRVARLTLRSGDRVGIVSTGYSSISVPLSSDPQTVDDALRRVTGDGFKPGELLDAGRVSARRDRASVAFETLRTLLQNLGDVPGRKVVINISGGYEAVPDEVLANLARTAGEVSAVIHAIEPSGLVSTVPNPTIDPGKWALFMHAAHDGLLALAKATGGNLLAAPADFDAALRRISADARDYYIVDYGSPTGDPVTPRRLVVRTTAPGRMVSHREWSAGGQ